MVVISPAKEIKEASDASKTDKVVKPEDVTPERKVKAKASNRNEKARYGLKEAVKDL